MGHRRTHRKDVAVEAGLKVSVYEHRNARGRQGSPGVTRREERSIDDFSLRASRRNLPYRHLDFGHLASQMVKE